VTGARIHRVVAGVSRAGLVDAIVGEMHETIAEVVNVVVVLDGSEAYKAIWIYVNLKRIKAGDKHVES